MLVEDQQFVGLLVVEPDVGDVQPALGTDRPALGGGGEVTSKEVAVDVRLALAEPGGVEPGGKLYAQGAEAIVVPRATEPGSYPRWRLVFQSVALTIAAWVVSVNRPADATVPIGGPSLVVSPAGEIVLETEEPLAVVTVDRAAVARGRESYPGYLPARCKVYADGWRAASQTS